MQKAEAKRATTILLPGSHVLAARRSASWALRLIWLVLPLDIVIAKATVLKTLNGDNRQFIAFETFLQITLIKVFAVLLVAAVLRVVFQRRLGLWVRSRYEVESASLAHLCFWLLFVWFVSLGIWLLFEMLHEVVLDIAGINEWGNSFMDTLQLFTLGSGGSFKLYQYEGGNVWGWYVPMAFFLALACGVLSLVRPTGVVVPSRLRSLLTAIALVLVLAFPLALANASAYCIKGNPDTCSLSSQFKLAFGLPLSQSTPATK